MAERKVSRMDIRSLGHVIPRKGRSHSSGTDLCGGGLQSLAIQRVEPPFYTMKGCLFSSSLAWNLRRHVPFHVLYILFIHFSNFEMTKAQVYGFPLHSILQVCIFYKEYYAVSLLPLSHEIID